MIPEILIKILVAAVFAIISGRFIIKNKEPRKNIESVFSNSALVFIVSIKISLVLTHFGSVKAEPMYLLYGWGSWLNTAIGVLAVLGYFIWYVYKKSENKILHAKFLLISSLVFFITFFGTSFLFTKTKNSSSVNMTELLEAKNLDGQQIKFHQNAPIILNFWATWCPPCRAEMPELNNFALENPQANFYAVNNISSEKEGIIGLNNFLNSKNYQFTVIPDYNNLLTEKFEIKSFPTTILLNSKGEILEKHVGVISKETLENWLQSYD